MNAVDGGGAGGSPEPDGGAPDGCSYGSSSLAWKMVRRYAGLCLPPALIVFHRLSVSTSFVLAALRALHVDSSGAVEVMAGTEEGWGLSRAV